MGFSSLNIGATALQTSQYALDITGHNIANASTSGYSRQVVNTSASDPNVKTFGALGTGTEISSIKSVTDAFLEEQVRSALSTTDYLGELQQGYEKLEVYFNELSDNDLSTAIDDFWTAASDMSNNVEDISTRQAFLEKAQSVCDSFADLDSNLAEFRSQLNDDVVQTVDDINALTKQIAELNVQIVETESGGATGVYANDLRDQREELVKELSGLADITVTEETNGSFTITQSNRFLVYQDKTFDLAVENQTEDGFLKKVPVFAADGEDLTLSSGLLAAQMEMRDETIPSYQNEVDQLAASFLWECNHVFSQGTGLTGYSELTGSTSVLSPASTLDKLDYSFDAMDGTYAIVNGNFELLVLDATSGETTTVTAEVDLDGSSSDPDTILYDVANPSAENALINKMQAAFDSVADGAFTVSLDRTGHVVVESNSSQYQFGFGEDTSGAVAALGLNTLFTGYDAGSIAVNGEMTADAQRLGCGDDFIDGDNTVALEFQELREATAMSDGTSTFDDFYQGIVSRLGIEGSRIDAKVESQESILTYVQNQRESLSGVNMDEELTKMIQYQRAYQGAARFISTVNECLETLINM